MQLVEAILNYALLCLFLRGLCKGSNNEPTQQNLKLNWPQLYCNSKPEEARAVEQCAEDRVKWDVVYRPPPPTIKCSFVEAKLSHAAI